MKNDASWAEEEFGEADLGDVRRTARLVPLALAVQDTTYLDWTDHTATTGLGPLATPTHQGLLAHTTLALTPEHVPLGLLQQQTWVRDATVGHPSLDDRIIKTADKRAQWLAVLKDPDIPLHKNDMELAVRRRVIGLFTPNMLQCNCVVHQSL